MSKGDPPQADMPDLRIGSYRILQPLGLGGMSSVFRAMHIETGHEVALKVLPRVLAKNPTLLQRFLREAKSAESLQHPNIVSIYDRGVDQGRHYLVLEFVPGGDFHEHVQRSGPLGVAEAVAVVKQVARGLDYAAGRGVIHRDIKPSNLLRTPSGQVKIIDLGLAIQSENEDERVTREGTTVGTVDYMAPEQARDSRATTIQSDMYSLGCTFYYLVTGGAPFPGGDITDKLSRHARMAPPDPRLKRPEIPDSIARIILRLLSKNPQDRFTSYGDLIAELDAAPRSDRKSTAWNPSAPIAIKDLPGGDLPSFDSASRPGEDSRHPGSTFPGFIPSISLAELVADHDGPSSRRRNGSADGLGSANAPGGIVSEPELETLPQYPGDHDISMPDLAARARQSRSDANWILGWVLTGAAAVVIVIGLDQLIRKLVVAPDMVPAPAVNSVPPPFGGGRPTPDPRKSSGQPHEGGAGRAKPRGNTGGVQVPAVGQRWEEPGDDVPEIPGQRFYDPATLARFVPEWATRPIKDTIEGPRVVVRRLAESTEASTAPDLRQGLDRLKGAIEKGGLEIAGNGPFHIDDFRISGASRLIRASPGFRPIIQFERSDLEIVREQPASIILDGKDLVLDGLDLVVDVRELPDRKPHALFQCNGTNLTLRNCTMTLFNPRASDFSLVRTVASSTRPSTIRLEGTLVRGTATTMFELGGAGDELVLDDSVILKGDGPIVRSVRFDPVVGQKISLVRSVLACRGPIIDLRGRFEAGGSKPIAVRLLGSALGRFHGVGISSVISASSPVESMDLAVDWLGEDNRFGGWKGYFAAGQDARILVAGFSELRSTWNASDHSSRESSLPWSPPTEFAFTTTNFLATYLLREGTTLKRVAQPSPNLYEKTIGSFLAPEIPEPVDVATAPQIATPTATTNPGMTGETPPEGSGAGWRGSGYPPNAGRRVGLELVFSTLDPEFQGDLGAFIVRKVPANSRQVRVVVQGSGRHRFTPIRLPDGMTLEILVDPPGPAGEEWISWSPRPTQDDRPLIELVGGQLMLSKLRVHLERDSRASDVIRVRDGQLVIRDCQFVRRAGDGAGDSLVNFIAPTTRPISVPYDQSILTPPADRPVCRIQRTVLITDGTALRGEMGRGLLAISQSAIAAGQAALDLMPTSVSRYRFDADLWIDRCTIISSHDFFRVLEWKGLRPGPERPWLINSSNTAYLAAYSGKPGETVLLRGDEGAIAHTDFFWQSNNDALDVECFMVSGAEPPPARSRDVELQWIKYWGSSHVRKTTGPRLSNKAPSVRLFDKLQSGRVEPSDLILDREYHPGRLNLDLGADLASLGIAPRKARVRPRR